MSEAFVRAPCRRFTFDFATNPESVGMATGATIHTANGLKVIVGKRPIAKVNAASVNADMATVGQLS